MTIKKINLRIEVVLVLLAAVLAVWSVAAFSAEGGKSDWVWVTTDGLLNARYAPTATLVEDPEGGKGVLLAGGQNATTTSSTPNFIKTTELYDMDKLKLIPGQPSMTIPRRQHTATLLTAEGPNQGKVLVVAGQTFTGGAPYSVKSCELLDPSNRGAGWKTTGSLSEARNNHTATLFEKGPNKGKVLVVGGELMSPPPTPPDPPVGPKRLRSCELYNPVDGNWTTKGSLSLGRDSHTATLLTTGDNAGKVLVVGGFYLDNPEAPNPKRLAIPTCELYDPVKESWDNATSLNHARGNHTATLLLDGGKILVAGGEDGNGTILRSYEIYDPKKGTWTANPNGKGLPVPCSQHAATRLEDGTVLLTGGNADPYASQIYNPKTDSWSLTREFLSFPRIAHTATLFKDGWVLVAGGIPNVCEIFRPRPALFKNEIYRPSKKPLTGGGGRDGKAEN